MIDTRPFVQTLKGRPVAVLGLGLSGLTTAKALTAGGGNVVGWDDKKETRDSAERNGVKIFDFTNDLKGYAALVPAPGIPLTHPAVAKAKEAGVEILGDIEILHRCNHGRKTIGVTGTNGKSTTTALIAHILNAHWKNAVMGGNIGKAVLALDLTPDIDTIVLEISSYQMDLCPAFRPDYAVLLNITPDHLDRHGSMEAYAAAKERMTEGKGVAVIGIDDPISLAIFQRVSRSRERDVIPISTTSKPGGGVYLKKNMLVNAIGEADTHLQPFSIGPLDDIPTLPGRHNLQNLCAAYTVCFMMNVAPADFKQHARTFPGLPHRQQLVRIVNGVAYINDSKATNGEAAAKAVACYSNIYLIAGGRAKDGGLAALEPYLERLSHVFLIGEAADDFARWLAERGVPYTKSFTLDLAVAEAHGMAQDRRGAPGAARVVLLSPACASWDQFRSFEHRGAVFTDLVMALPGEASL